ncbi:MAG: hypothetical protein ABIH49_01025 [archaeon]
MVRDDSGIIRDSVLEEIPLNSFVQTHEVRGTFPPEYIGILPDGKRVLYTPQNNSAMVVEHGERSYD